MARVTLGPIHASSPPKTYGSSPPKSFTGRHVEGLHMDTLASDAVDSSTGGSVTPMASWLTPLACACRVSSNLCVWADVC